MMFRTVLTLEQIRHRSTPGPLVRIVSCHQGQRPPSVPDPVDLGEAVVGQFRQLFDANARVAQDFHDRQGPEGAFLLVGQVAARAGGLVGGIDAAGLRGPPHESGPLVHGGLALLGLPGQGAVAGFDGQGATHGTQRLGSSAAQRAMSCRTL